MSAPARDARDGEQRRKEVRRDIQHLINEAGIHIHIGAHDLFMPRDLGEHARRHALDRLHQLQLVEHAALGGQRAGALPQDDGARIGQGIDRVAHAVDQAAAVAKLAAQDAADAVGHGVIVLPVADGLLDEGELRQHLPVRAAVLRPLQRADGRGDGGIGVRPRGRDGAAGERGVIAAAVLCMAHKAQVEQPRLLLGEVLVRADHAQEVLRRGQLRLRPVEIEAVVVKIMPLYNIGIGRDDREARNELDGLAHHILDTQAVRVRVAGIQGKDGPPELVHDVVARIFQDHVLRKILRQIRKIMQQALEHVVLLLIGQVAEEQQVPKRCSRM